jgi:hypothetical protein
MSGQYNQGYGNVNGYGNANNLSNGLSGFRNWFTPTYANTYDKYRTGYQDSQSMISKFSFLILMLFIFVILLRLGIMALAYFMKPNDSPKLIDGMINAKQMVVINQDPSKKGNKTVYKSVNENEGLEFSWSVWIYIEDLGYNANQYKNIFYKGNSSIETTGDNKGKNMPNNAPGLYIAPNSNKLVVIMDTFDVVGKDIEIDNVPMNKWLNVIIRCHNTTLDVYINGTITRSIELSSVPKQNYGEVYAAANGGFDGYISNLWYFNHALGMLEIQSIAMKGPNTTMAGTSPINLKTGNFLSTQWYFSGDDIA